MISFNFFIFDSSVNCFLFLQSETEDRTQSVALYELISKLIMGFRRIYSGTKI